MTYNASFNRVYRGSVLIATAETPRLADQIVSAMNQAAQPRQDEPPLPLDDHGPLFDGHAVRQENDEYACRCGKRWDVADGEEHP